MKIGTPVISVKSLTIRDDCIAVGCEGGKFAVYDVNSKAPIYSFQHSEDVVIVEQIDSDTLYASTENEIFMHDLRITPNLNSVYQSNSEINDISANGTLLAVAKIDGNISLKDKRNFKKGKTHPLPPFVPTSIKFLNRDKLAAGYIDTSIGFWELSKKRFVPFKTPASNSMNPPVVHCLDLFQDYCAVARQDGLAVFKDGKLIIDNKFLHEGAVETVTFAPCFDSTTIISGANDGSVMAFDLEKLAPIDCLTVDSEKIECVSANKKFISIADTSEEGNIAIFTPEDFSGEEEDNNEKEEEEKKE